MSETLGSQRRLAWGAALWAYLSVDVLLMLSALVLPPRGSGFALAAVTVLGVAALTVGIWRQRPHVPVAWWLLAAGSALSAGVAIAGDVVFGPSVVPGPVVWLRYSSLASVARLPVDIVKLDRSFIQSSGQDAGTTDWTFTRAILEMVNALRLQIVAEGVETVEQVELLRKMHYPLVQGFFFAGPMSREPLDSVLSNSDRIR